MQKRCMISAARAALFWSSCTPRRWQASATIACAPAASRRFTGGSTTIGVEVQLPSTATVVVHENLMGRFLGLAYVIVTAPVSSSFESV